MYLFLGFIFLLFFVYVWWVEPAWLSIRKEVVEVDPAKLHTPLRLLFLSDIHAGVASNQATAKQHLRALTERHRETPFDALLLGGDFIDSSTKYISRIAEIVNIVKEWDVPIYAVLGNHDWAASDWQVDEFASQLQQMGMEVLRNQAVVFTKGSQELLLIGLEELQSSPDYYDIGRRASHYDEYRQRVQKLDWYQQFDEVKPNHARVVLSHNPDSVYLPGKPPELVLAGHTHGGQLSLVNKFSHRLYGSVIIPAGSFLTWAGRRLINKTTLIVGRGFGGSTLPVRLFCRPEVVIIELVPAKLPDRLMIGLSGKPRSGKDTAAAMILSVFPGITPVAVGDAIKIEYDAAHHTNTLHDEEEKQKHRPGIQKLGNDRRAVDLDYWIKKTLQQEPPILVKDVRFAHEMEAVHRAGGIMIRIEADHKTLRQRMGEYYDQQINHENERQLDHITDWDYVIHNHGTLFDLERQVQDIAEKIRSRLNKK
jgi:phosphomevalonate kinase